MTLALPLAGAGTAITGMVYGVVNLKSLWEVTAELHLSDGGRAYVVDQFGQVIATDRWPCAAALAAQLEALGYQVELAGTLSLVQKLEQELGRISVFVAESGWAERISLPLARTCPLLCRLRIERLKFLIG